MAHVALKRDTGEPDAVMLGDQARDRVRLRRRLCVSVPLAVLVVGATVVAIARIDHPWPWLVFYGLTGLCLAGTINILSDRTTERPRPDTELEVAVVVGIEPTTWGAADGYQHTMRVIARPIGSSADRLIHADQHFDSRQGFRLRAGMHVGFRRYPVLRHLVWMTTRPDAGELLALRTGLELPASEPLPATVTALAIGEAPEGDWWPTTITVGTDTGLELRETSLRLPEELAAFEPGAQVRVLRRPGSAVECLIVPRTLETTRRSGGRSG